ncbi:hypothetical protein DPMN_154001 [Dreissena polymorpha]|uniref:Uncharacterized protein n=1 Tax=Dreissena polymorpha TaxID=45954 RepID=A0A9D4FND6_DREPO|nr:hypothetical protein DPMN_154001 [Dreissena polymorpha]
MNLLTKFHEDRKMKNVPPLGSHVFQSNVIIFELIQDIIRTNLLIKFHEDWTMHVASRVLTMKNALPPGGHVLKATKTILELTQDIIWTNLLTRVLSTRKNARPPPPGGHFHEDRIKNVAHTVKNAPPLGSHVFQANATIFELVQYIIGMNILTKFLKDRSINVASSVLTRENAPLPDIIWTNLLTKFHEDRKINVAARLLTRKNAPPPGSHVFQPARNLFGTRIIGMNPLTRGNAPPLGSHVFQANVTIFEVIQDVIKTNLLTKFHDDWTINVASRVVTRQMLTPHNARRTKYDHKSSP